MDEFQIEINQGTNHVRPADDGCAQHGASRPVPPRSGFPLSAAKVSSLQRLL